MRRARVHVAIVLLAVSASCRRGGDEATPLVVGGRAAAGPAAIQKYGCGGCHTIPGIRTANGLVGPPLTDWAGRHYIAGNLPNLPDNLVRWIMAPQSVEPGTVMPNLGVTLQDARDIAAHLYTLGHPRELGAPHLFPQQWLHDLMPERAKKAH